MIQKVKLKENLKNFNFNIVNYYSQRIIVYIKE